MRRFAGVLACWVFVPFILAVFTPSAWADSNELAKEKSKPSIMTAVPDSTPVSDYTGNFLERSTLFGDPDGKRQWLYDKGVALDLGVTQVYQGVTSGGKDKEWEYSGTADYSLALDSQRIGLWPAGLLMIHGRTKVGRSINFTAGTLSPVNDPYTTPDSDEDNESFLEEYYILQGLTGKLWFMAGRILFANFIDINRFAHDSQTQFMNTALKNSLLLGVLTDAWSTHGIGLSYQATPNISVSPFLLSSNDKDGVWGSPGGLFSEYSSAACREKRFPASDTTARTPWHWTIPTWGVVSFLAWISPIKMTTGSSASAPTSIYTCRKGRAILRFIRRNSTKRRRASAYSCVSTTPRRIGTFTTRSSAAGSGDVA
jgi:hypothetical protein